MAKVLTVWKNGKHKKPVWDTDIKVDASAFTSISFFY